MFLTNEELRMRNEKWGAWYAGRSAVSSSTSSEKSSSGGGSGNSKIGKYLVPETVKFKWEDSDYH